jgi:hypothetical protein
MAVRHGRDDSAGKRFVRRINNQCVVVSIKYNDAPTLARYSDQFGEGLPGVLEVLENTVGSACVERIRWELEVVGIADSALDWQALSASSGHAKHGLTFIDADNTACRPYQVGQLAEIVTCSTAHIEYCVASSDRHRSERLALVGLGSLQSRDRVKVRHAGKRIRCPIHIFHPAA